MERLKERLAVAEQAHATLEEALQIRKPSKLERDGAIQRFEYTFEACWKTCQHYLHAVEGGSVPRQSHASGESARQVS